MPRKTDAMSIIAATFVPLAGSRILDIGCGKGALARSLSDRGARVVGVDPNLEALEAARKSVPTGAFCRADAEEMPFANQSFDGAIFLNSLHHVPKPAMRRALREADRVVKATVPIVIIEPLAEGPLFSVLRLVEDETDVRAAAQGAIEEALASGSFEKLDRVDYLRREYFAGLDEFLTHALSVEPERAIVVEERRSEIEAAFRHHARVAADGRASLEQPMRAHVLRGKT